MPDYIHWYDVAILLMSLTGAILQFWGAKLDSQPCRTIKIAYGISLSILFFLTLFMKIITNLHGVFQYATVLLLFTIICGSTVRLLELRNKRRSMCRECH